MASCCLLILLIHTLLYAPEDQFARWLMRPWFRINDVSKI